MSARGWNFPSFSEGLSLRLVMGAPRDPLGCTFPFLFGGTFIEACGSPIFRGQDRTISLPFRRDFH